MNVLLAGRDPIKIRRACFGPAIFDVPLFDWTTLLLLVWRWDASRDIAWRASKLGCTLIFDVVRVWIIGASHRVRLILNICGYIDRVM